MSWTKHKEKLSEWGTSNATSDFGGRDRDSLWDEYDAADEIVPLEYETLKDLTEFLGRYSSETGAVRMVSAQCINGKQIYRTAGEYDDMSDRQNHIIQQHSEIPEYVYVF